ncbi:hypothetical protein CJ030_MR6G028562 [Morella rubra]|uniref:Uncharacterized protein n=1 Tax=Morella rubra TaxID=262757 RepID=A0A6A1VF30_9ROSI|nr:hypothetical protein CJ030_MR6G028562 [Morella rubra]
MLPRLEFFLIGDNFLGNGGGDDLRFLCSLKNASNLREMIIAINNFGGVLPDCISNFSTTLRTLALEQNKIFGSIPPGLGNLITLESLSARDNRLSGHIPLEIENLSKLQYLDLSGNNFSGNIPPSLGNLKLLSKLFLGGNNLSGVIPSSLAECRNLWVLSLSSNNLRGSLPPELIGLSFSPIYIDLSANQFTGVLPMK